MATRKTTKVEDTVDPDVEVDLSPEAPGLDPVVEDVLRRVENVIERINGGRWETTSEAEWVRDTRAVLDDVKALLA